MGRALFCGELILQAGVKYGKLFNGGSYKSVAKFKAEFAGSDNIHFNDTAAPGAPDNSKWPVKSLR